jgi:hypothetical protein
MTIKPIDENKAHDVPYGKILFLVALVLLSLAVISMPRQEIDTSEIQAKKNEQQDVLPKPTTSKKEVNYREELVKEVGEKYTGVADTAKEKTDELTEDVLGIAQEKVEDTSSKSANVIKNTIYKNTVGEVIKQLIFSMPEGAWEEMKPDVCKPAVTITPEKEKED